MINMKNALVIIMLILIYFLGTKYGANSVQFYFFILPAIVSVMGYLLISGEHLFINIILLFIPLLSLPLIYIFIGKDANYFMVLFHSMFIGMFIVQFLRMFIEKSKR